MKSQQGVLRDVVDVDKKLHGDSVGHKNTNVESAVLQQGFIRDAVGTQGELSVDTRGTQERSTRDATGSHK
eukprot:14485044-Alexandrium_andersonii.AAC.1